MKKTISIYILTALMLTSVSCKKALEIQPVSSITNASYWKSEGDVAGYMTGIYSDFRGLMNTTLYGEDRGDAFVAGLEGAVTTAWAQNLTSSNAPNWLNFYNQVHHCNLVIKYGSQFPTTMNLNRLLAQAYFMRAMNYFLLIKSWNNVPIVLQPTESDESLLPGRSSASAVMTQILADIDQSIALFPEAGYVNKYRASKPAAYALKADALLWKYKVLKGTTDDLQNAITAVDFVMASGVSLLPNFADIHATDKKKNAEIIFSLFFLRDERSDQYGSRLKPRDIFVAAAANKATIPYAVNGARSVYAPSPKIQQLYATNDVRKAASIITAVDAGGAVIGVFDNKFRGTAYADDRYWENDIVVYRAAEMILFRAEALAALNRTPEAITELNKVRVRAGIGAYTGATDKQSVERQIFDERFRELWFELKRWPDIVRFHFGGTINAYTEVPNLVGKSVPLFFPIPKTQIDINPNLTQTDGYTN
jgi:hypothetical protein